MLRSMTGQGQSHRHGPIGAISIELRTVNNRGFKLVSRIPDALSSLESRIETIIREEVRRGTVQLNCVWQRADGTSRYKIDTNVFRSYCKQLADLRAEAVGEWQLDLVRVASLPGCVIEPMANEDLDEEICQEVEASVRAALACLNQMRDAEGLAMQRQLLIDLQLIEDCLGRVQERTPAVVDSYRERLRAKMESMLTREGLPVEIPDLLREIAVFSDRSDISEEITRLLSHGQLFRKTVDAMEASGRKLDFVIQEMFRETNTIGAKAGDAEIAQLVVEMKCAIERMRELVQNVE